jgi:beta-glucosidase-like glycosyl hydrolase
MAFGAVGDTKEVEHFTAVTAQQARAIGVQWAFAPVADVNSNPANPVINTRSFGEDPDQVGALVAAFVRGAHKYGLLVTPNISREMATLPADSHRRIASVDGAGASAVRISAIQQAIAAGVDAIVLAHARYLPAEPDPVRSRQFLGRSANLEDQRIQGVVVTDA